MSNLADQAETLAAATKSHLYPDPVLETLRDLAAENRRLSAEVERLQFVFEVKEEALRQAVAEAELLRPVLAAAREVRSYLLSHSSGGDRAMIFDEFDAAVERGRRGYWTVDDHAIDHLEAALDAYEKGMP